MGAYFAGVAHDLPDSGLTSGPMQASLRPKKDQRLLAEISRHPHTPTSAMLLQNLQNAILGPAVCSQVLQEAAVPAKTTSFDVLQLDRG